MGFLGRLGVRFDEASTWRGLVMIIAALGLNISPEQAGAIISAGMAVSGLIGVFVVDKLEKKDV